MINFLLLVYRKLLQSILYYDPSPSSSPSSSSSPLLLLPPFSLSLSLSLSPSLVPRAKQLLACVSAGDISSVQKYLTSLEAPTSSQDSLEAPTSSQDSLEVSVSSQDSVEDLPLSKRPRLDLTETVVSKPFSPDVSDLLECAEHNSNILHLCCVISEDGVFLYPVYTCTYCHCIFLCIIFLHLCKFLQVCKFIYFPLHV